MDPVVPSRLGTLVLQGVGVIATSVVTTAAVGSLILRGNVITDNTVSNAPSLILGSGSYLTYRECQTGSGRRVFDGCSGSATGGLSNYNTCVIANPYDGTDAPFNGSGAIVRYQYDVIANPAASPIDIGTVSSTSTSGSDIINSLVIGTGASAVWTGSGSSPISNPSGLIQREKIVTKGGSIKAVTTTDPTQSYRASCKVWMTEANLKGFR